MHSLVDCVHVAILHESYLMRMLLSITFQQLSIAIACCANLPNSSQLFVCLNVRASCDILAPAPLSNQTLQLQW